MSNFDFGIPYKTANEIRSSFFEFFEKRNHTFVKSDAVYPADDPTILFTNSGMNQFKSIFLGDNKNNLKRVYNSQKCLRVSGKHNDLDEVGRDTYHHTFFEMLGNWSFGDYYKEEAITWAWELLTKVWKLPKERLFATVYTTDDEAMEIWKTKTDIDHHRIMRFEKDNFWEMGAVGPCGPCSEIHFDLGDLATQNETYQDKIGGVNGEDGRYVEIWNLVFMQNERLANGTITSLKEKHVDTGSGLERICSVIQGTGSNYETDLFKPIIDKISKLTKVPYDRGEKGTPHRVIADHLRAMVFGITDGITPSNEGRGYVLRRILRRASRFANGLGQKEPFLYKLVPTLVEIMKEPFPEVEKRSAYVMQVLEAEETRFLKTLDAGLHRINKIIAETQAKKKTQLSGEDVFSLYDTYGFPMDLTRQIAEEHSLTVDEKGYEKNMQAQKERARSAAKFDTGFTVDENWNILDRNKSTEFLGYTSLESKAKTLRYRELDDFIYIVCDKTPFYAESGGQVGDQGKIIGKDLELRVVDTVKVLDMTIHKCSLINGILSENSVKEITLTVNSDNRKNTYRNHSATHLLHAALQKLLGDHVSQQGSYVDPYRLRFDFTHHQAMTKNELKKIEDIVNEDILDNYSTEIAIQSFDEAKKAGATALFGEKYGDEVRVVELGPNSKELCGGTHVKATGEIGSFRILSESSVASGIRRIEGVTGKEALKLARNQKETLEKITKELKAKPDTVITKVVELVKNSKAMEKELLKSRIEKINEDVTKIISDNKKTVGNNYMVVKKLDLRMYPKATHASILESCAAKLDTGAAVFTLSDDDSLSILVAVGNALRSKLKAGNLVKELSEIAGGRGGGRPDRAQAGSKHPEKEQLVLSTALEKLQSLLQ